MFWPGPRPLWLLVLLAGGLLVLQYLQNSPNTGTPQWHDPGYALPPFDLLPLPQLEVEQLTPKHMFRVPAVKGKFKDVEDRSLLRLLPHSIHKYVCELNRAALDQRGVECDQALPLREVLDVVLPPRRVYLDLGTQAFNSSVGWFKRNYPVEFTQIYSWEVVPNLFVKPSAELAAAEMNLTLGEARRWLESITHFNAKVTAEADQSVSDVVHLLQTRVRREDFVVMKMDIEGEEWNVIPRLEATGAMHLIDEFFVEIHFHNKMMQRHHWDRFSHTLEETTEVVQRLRSREDLFFHYWP